jgi:hypothetical protein
MLMTPMNIEVEVKHLDIVALGFMVAESGLAGIIDFRGTLASDGTRVRSTGQASADKLRIARNGSPAGNPVSLQYTIDYDLVRQSGTVADTKIGYGKAVARLNGNYEMRGNDLTLKLTLQGTSMPVGDLTALFPAFGVMLPKGASLQGGFLNTNLVTEGPAEKLITSGTVEISNTRLVGFDLSGKMAAVASLAGLRPNQDTEIEKFFSGLRLTPEGIQASNLQLVVPALGELVGGGRIAADQTLDFTMRAKLKPGSSLGAGLAHLVQGGDLIIPFSVRGTASDPKFVPDFKKAASGLLESALGQGAKEGTKTGDVLGNTLRNVFQKKK